VSTRILAVEDEPDFVRYLTDALKPDGFTVLSADSGPAGLKAAVEGKPDLILLDWNLPGLDGLEVCRRLKADPATASIPVLLLTARGRETDVVLGLEMGAEDFITKRALRPRELVARIRAALRRAAPRPLEEAVLRSGALSLDVARRRLAVGQEEIDLPAKEFELLRLFLQHKGRVLTRRLIGESVWGEEIVVTSRAMDSAIARLRVKMGSEGYKIQAVVNVGYRFEEDE
jgi:two-component system phosphate regulon response regulator PhoB